MTHTKIDVRLVRRPRIPVMRSHGLWAPVVALINMIVLCMVIMYVAFKWTAIMLYLSGRGAVRVARRARYPRVRQTDWLREK